MQNIIKNHYEKDDIICDKKNKCTSYPKSCKGCKRNEGRRDYYEPDKECPNPLKPYPDHWINEWKGKSEISPTKTKPLIKEDHYIPKDEQIIDNTDECNIGIIHSIQDKKKIYSRY